MMAGIPADAAALQTYRCVLYAATDDKRWVAVTPTDTVYDLMVANELTQHSLWLRVQQQTSPGTATCVLLDSADNVLEQLRPHLQQGAVGALVARPLPECVLGGAGPFTPLGPHLLCRPRLAGWLRYYLAIGARACYAAMGDTAPPSALVLYLFSDRTYTVPVAAYALEDVQGIEKVRGRATR